MRDINNKLNALSAYMDLQISSIFNKLDNKTTELFDYHGVRDEVKVKGKTVKRTKLLSEFEIIESLLKKRGYQRNGNIYTKGFVIVKADTINYNVLMLSIRHDVGLSDWHTIDASFITGLVVMLDYFERL